MERNFDQVAGGEAAVLDALSADRQRLARQVRVPWTLMAAFGALGAWWVGSAVGTEPGSDYEPPLTGWMALLGVLIVSHLMQRETGIRFRSLGAGANGAIGAIVMVCLVLFSISLGLVAAGLTWAVVVTSLAAFATTTWLSGIACRSAVARLGRG